MQIRCPHCNNGVEVVAESEFDSMICGSCGSQFGLVDESDIATFERSANDQPQLAHFELLQEVGSGAFGTVWRARDLELERIVAVKIPRKASVSASEQEQFFREARSAAQLNHPGIVSVHEVGRVDERLYIVSDFVEGITLADWMTAKRASPREAVKLCVKVAQALEHAHDHGVIHRDMKPANIMLDADHEPQIMDFGMAKRDAAEVTITMEGQLLGTPAYMPPEQARGEGHDVDARADIYSLGVILFEMLTGERPFRGSTRMLLHQVIHDDAPSLRKLQSSIPRDVETIALKCLQKDPGKRYGSCGELIADFNAWLEHQPIVARPIGSFGKLLRWRNRNPVVANLSVAIGIVLVLSAGLSMSYAIEARQESTRAVKSRNDATEQAAIAIRQKGEAEQARRDEAEQRRIATVEKERALQSEMEAKAQTQRAQDSEAEAILQTKRAIESETKALRRAYTSDMLLMQKYWDSANPEHMREVLDRHDNYRFKGFEWYYWNRQIQSEWAVLKSRGFGLNCIAISFDGSRIVSGSSDKSVNVWDVASGKLILTITGHPTEVVSIAFSPDGKRIVSGDKDGAIKIWDAKTGESLRVLEGHSKWVQQVAFSPAGSQVVSVCSAGTLKLWDAMTGQEVFSPEVHSDGALCVAFSPDGTQLVSGGIDRMVAIWDAKTGEKRRTLQGHIGHVTSVAFSPDGSRIVSGSNDQTVVVWDLMAGRKMLTLTGHVNGVLSVAFSPDGKRIASASRDRTIKIWDAVSGVEKYTHKGHLRYVHSVAYSPDGIFIASGSVDNTIRIWDPNEGLGKLELLGGTISGARAVDFSPDGNRIAGGDNTVKVWDAETSRVLLTIKGYNGHVNSLTFSPDGKRIVGGMFDRTVKIWDADTGQEALTLTGHSQSVVSVAISPSGKQIASGSYDETVKIWDAETGHELISIAAFPYPATNHRRIGGVDFSPDGKRVVCVSSDGFVKIWDVATGESSFSTRGHRATTDCAAFSPNGDQFATGSFDQTVKIWDTKSGTEIFTLKGHAQGVKSVAFSPDGKRIVSGSADSTVKVWDVETGQELLTLTGHSQSVMSVAFSPDGKRIVSGSSDKTVRIWDARPLKNRSRR